MIIDRFRGEYFFLSNCYPATTPHRGRLFPTSEHAYMAARTEDAGAIAAILATPDPLEAQKIGWAARQVDGWDQLRFAVMDEIVTSKFTHSSALAAKLVATAGALLVEGNTWHDQTWGTCTCEQHRNTPGANALGVCLMAVRMRLEVMSADRLMHTD